MAAGCGSQASTASLWPTPLADRCLNAVTKCASEICWSRLHAYPCHSQGPTRIDLLRSFVELGETMDTDLVVRGQGVEAWCKSRVRQEYAAEPQMVEPA